MLDRIDETTTAAAKTHLRHSVRQTMLDQVWITTSGFFTTVPFIAALMSFGVDRIMFSVDYPFASNSRARAFLDALPVSPADRAKIAHGNADRLCREQIKLAGLGGIMWPLVRVLSAGGAVSPSGISWWDCQDHFPEPTCHVSAHARRGCQGWPRRRRGHRVAARSVLDSPEHGASLTAGRDGSCLVAAVPRGSPIGTPLLS